MKFGKYQPLWKQPTMHNLSMEQVGKILQNAVDNQAKDGLDLDLQLDYNRFALEERWYVFHRPYYLVYPCVIEMVKKLKLDTPVVYQRFRDLTVPVDEEGVDYTVICCQFPSESDTQLEAVVASWLHSRDGNDLEFHRRDRRGGRRPGGQYKLDGITSLVQYSVQGINKGERFSAGSWQALRPDTTLGTLAPESLGGEFKLEHPDNDLVNRTEADKQYMVAMRLIAVLPMLAESGTELLENDVLSKDRGKPLTEAIIRRAAARKGPGWTLGRKLEEVPATRRPHWSHRWMKPEEGESPLTGDLEGLPEAARRGLIPKLRPIKGSVVRAHKVEQVPHGYEPVPRISGR